MTAKARGITILLCSMIFISIFPSLAFAFPDTREHWARSQIDHLQARELISGYPGGYFRPDAYISRQEFVTILVKCLHKEDEALKMMKADATFIDTKDTWAKGYIEIATELQIAQGNGRGYFNPTAYISREEAATLLVHALKNQNSESQAPELAFTDANEISFWARQSVGQAYESGLISGYPDETFRPQGNLTRAEVASLFEAFLGNQGERYQMHGTLLRFDLATKKAVILVNDRQEVFELAQMVVAYNEKDRLPAKEIELPTEVYFDLDANGKLVYALFPNRERSKATFEYQTLNPPAIVQIASLLESEIGSLQETPAQSYARSGPTGSSMDITRNAMNADRFIAETSANGRGQLVAIIDSGIDAGHPDLRTTTDQFAKVLDFIDLTGEGRILLDKTVMEQDKKIKIDGNTLDTTNVKSVDGVFRYGYMKPERFPTEFASQMGQAGMLVIATKSEYIDRYDRLYLDLDMDGKPEFAQAFSKYSAGQQVAALKLSNGKPFNFVVSDIAKDGIACTLGFDILGHGTQVSGIVAANGEVQGIAPGAQLLVIKVTNSAGLASLDHLKAAMNLAAERGAQVAVISMGQQNLSESDRKSLSNTASTLWNTYKMIICIAAGNDGPGIGTASSTAAIRNVISVGAYATPEMWSHDYGWEVEKPTLWYFSSVGPAADGQAIPMVVAPGSVVSTYPLWTGNAYALGEGTSMAAPHVAGAAALLLDAAVHKLYRGDARAVYHALLGGARPLEGIQAVEQGYGRIDLQTAWRELKNLAKVPVSIQAKEYSLAANAEGSGYYSRSLQPGRLSVTLNNPNPQSSHLVLGGLSPWIVPEQYLIQVPPNSERSVSVSFAELTEPGLYSDFLVADDIDTPGRDAGILQTVIIPYRLAEVEKNTVKLQGSLGAGQFQRYFFEVSPDSQDLQFKLSVGDAGRCRMHLVAPDGTTTVSGYAGLGDIQQQNTVEISSQQPIAGVWELVVYSSVTLGTLGLNRSGYTLETILNDPGTELNPSPEVKYLVSTVVEKVQAGELLRLTLHFLNPFSKTPANGYVAIENKIYQIKKGIVQLAILPKTENLHLTIGW